MPVPHNHAIPHQPFPKTDSTEPAVHQNPNSVAHAIPPNASAQQLPTTQTKASKWHLAGTIAEDLVLALASATGIFMVGAHLMTPIGWNWDRKLQNFDQYGPEVLIVAIAAAVLRIASRHISAAYKEAAIIFCGAALFVTLTSIFFR